MKLLARHDPHPALFDAYAGDAAGAAPATTTAAPQAALRAFELMLLREIGLLPELDVVTPTQQPVDAAAALRAAAPRPASPRAAATMPRCRRARCVGLQAALDARQPGRAAAGLRRRAAGAARASCARCFTIIWARRCCARARS